MIEQSEKGNIMDSSDASSAGKTSNLRMVSLFCGCGGFDLGVKGGFDYLGHHYGENGVDIVYANDIDTAAAKMYQANFGQVPDLRDINEIDSSEIPDTDIITGGFPCQSFSVAAENEHRLGVKDDRGKLFFEMCRIIRDKQPLCFIAENVPGLLTANDGEAFPLIISEFRNCGYEVVSSIMDASQFGIPQKRQRVIMVGIRKDVPAEFSFGTIRRSNHPEPLSSVLEQDVPERYHYSRDSVDRQLRKKKSERKYHIQDPSKPCRTIGSHLWKTSLNSSDPVLETEGGLRRFTQREVARIQGFPDSFTLTGGGKYQYHALGNAVPPVMIWHVANPLCDLLREQL